MLPAQNGILVLVSFPDPIPSFQYHTEMYVEKDQVAWGRHLNYRYPMCACYRVLNLMYLCAHIHSLHVFLQCSFTGWHATVERSFSSAFYRRESLSMWRYVRPLNAHLQYLIPVKLMYCLHAVLALCSITTALCLPLV